MSEATITSKGQVTIPADIRRTQGLHAGVRLMFTPMPDGTVLLRAKTRSILDLKGILKPPPGVVVSIDDMRMK
jgi:AbrB family looped-hinge helix DNA binding protein